MQVANSVGTFITVGQKPTHGADNKTSKELFSECIQAEYEKVQNSMPETDWRDMTSEQWDKLVSNLDEYIDYYKAELEQREIMIKKAAEEAILKAPAEMRAQAASRAALMVAANGHSEVGDVETKTSADSKNNCMQMIIF